MCFALGQVLAWLASHGLSESEAPGRRALAWTAAFGLLGWLPVGLYFLVAHPAWSWAYAVQDAPLNPTLVIFALCAEFGMLLLGYFWSCELLRRGSVWAPVLFALALLIYLLALILPGDAFLQFGTAAQHQAGDTKALWESPRLIVELLLSGAWLVVWLLLVRKRLSN